METTLVERVLRDLPGVLDCSVQDEGIAIVVHPEIDPRNMELRAQMALAEIGERRPLLVVGGMSSGFEPPRPPVGRQRRPFARRSPVSLAGFAILVVALITVVPIAGGGGKDGGSRLPTVAAPSFDAPSFDAPSFGSLPVIDEPGAVVAAAARVVGPVAPAVRAVAQVVRHSPAGSVAVAVPVVKKAADPPARTVSAADRGKAKAKANAKAKAGGGHAKPAKAQGRKGR